MHTYWNWSVTRTWRTVKEIQNFKQQCFLCIAKDNVCERGNKYQTEFNHASSIPIADF